jgi:hypothetical protein
MIAEYVFVDGALHRVCSERMLRRLTVANVVLCVVLITVWAVVFYVGFHIFSNEQIFEKNMDYKKIQNVPIFPQQYSVVHVHFVKKLVFLRIKVY